MFQWASNQFDKLTEAVAPPPTDAAGRFSYAVTRNDEATAMGVIAEIDPTRTVVNQTKGWFPIHMACQYSMVRLLRLLTNQPGVSIQQPDYAGNTPLHHACMSTQRATGLEVVKLLINEYSADPCAKNSNGQTPYDVATLDSIRQYILPIQLQRETQYALDNGGVGLAPGIDLGGLKINRSNMAPPPQFGGAGVVAAPPASAGAAAPSSRYPQTPGMAAPGFGSPMATAGSAPAAQQPIPSPQPIARAPASMPGRSIAKKSARTQSEGESRHARSGGSSLAIYSKYKADGFHSSSSDVSLQKKYGHVGVNKTGVAPPPGSGNAPAPVGPNPFSGAGNLGGVSRYAAYGPTAAPAPVSGPAFGGMGLPAAPQVAPTYFTPMGSAPAPAAPATPSSTSLPTSPFISAPPYSGAKTAEPVAATPVAPAPAPMSSPFVSNQANEPAASSLFESPPKTSAETPKEEPAAAEASSSDNNTDSDWIETTDPNTGQTYYFNSKTNETSWEKPGGEAPTQPTEQETTEGDWSETVDPSSGQTYYYNHKTGETSWEKPAGFTDPAAENGAAPSSEWVETTDPSSGNTYYYNSVTGETSWERPAALEEKPVTPEESSEPVAESTGDTITEEKPEDQSPQSANQPVEPIQEETSEAMAEEETEAEDTIAEEPTPVEPEPKPEDEKPVADTPVEESTSTASEPATEPTAEVKTEETSSDILPEGWIEATDPSSGKVYYCNMTTQETSWTRPESSEADTKPTEETEESTSTPDEWEEVQDPTTGKTYYFNKQTQETSWEKPTATTSEPAADSAATSAQEESEWVETLDPSSGKNYYYNSKTGETSWEKPAALIAEEEKPAATENESQPVDTSATETTEPLASETQPQSSPMATINHQRTLSADDLFASPPAQSTTTPGPSTTRPDFISPAAATQGSVVSPGDISTPGQAATTAEDLFGASAADPTPAKTAEDLFGASAADPTPAKTAEDLFGAKDEPVPFTADPTPAKMPETAEDLFGSNNPEPTPENTTDDTAPELDDDEDGGMTDIPLSPEPVRPAPTPTTNLPSVPDTTAAAPAPAPAVSNDLFAAIGMPPPPFQTRR